MREEEERRRKEEESQLAAIAQAKAVVESLRSEAAARNQLRAAEGAVNPETLDLRQFDSSIKRNTAAVKKLRAVTEEGLAALLDELRCALIYGSLFFISASFLDPPQPPVLALFF